MIHENPEFDILDITRKMREDMLNIVNVSNQEAAWYFLRKLMSKNSISVVYINTI